MQAVRCEVFGHGVIRAATRAVNLCFAGVLATSSVILQSWPMFGVSVAGYATLVAWDLSRVGFWKRVLHEARTRPPALPDPDAFADTGARHFLNRLHHARTELRRVLMQNSRAVPPRLLPQLETIPEVERRALALIERLEEISRYLADKNVRGLRNEVDRLQRASQTVENPRLSAELGRAHFAVAEELSALEEIAAAKDLLAAKLETYAGCLEMFPCEIVRLQVLEADLRDDDDPIFDPRAIIEDTDSFEEMLTAPIDGPARPAAVSSTG